MKIPKRADILKILGTTTWVLLGMGTMLLLIASVNKKKNDCCKAVDIIISGSGKNYFIDKADVNATLLSFSDDDLVGKPIASFNMAAMEHELQKNQWIKSAELFFDNNNILKVKITERNPVARVFSNNGSSFYLDEECLRLPLSDKFSARVPVFTGFPTENIILSKEDSNLLTGIKVVSQFISKNQFWMAQIDQVDITPKRTFEMIPKIGQQVIEFGDANDCQQKFNNLLSFYQRVESKVGWNMYSRINLKYNGQVIAEKRGAQEIKTDSLLTIQLMKVLAANALKQASDTLHNIQLVQPAEENIIPKPLADDSPEAAQPYHWKYADTSTLKRNTQSPPKLKPVTRTVPKATIQQAKEKKVVPHSSIPHNTVTNKTVQHNTATHNTATHNTAAHNTAAHNTVIHNTVTHNTVTQNKATAPKTNDY